MPDLQLPIDYTSLSSLAIQKDGGAVGLKQLLDLWEADANLVQLFPMDNCLNIGENTEGATDLDNILGVTSVVGDRSDLAASMDASSYLAKKVNTDWEIANAWSVAFVTNQAGADTGEAYFQIGNSGVNGLNMFKFISDYVYVLDSTGTPFKHYTGIPVSAAVTLGHLTWDGSSLKVYLGGSDITGPLGKPTDAAGTMTNTTRHMYIGGATNNAGGTIIEKFDGSVDMLAVFDTALSPATIAAHNAAFANRYSTGGETVDTDNVAFGKTLSIDPTDIGIRIDAIAADTDVKLAWDIGAGFTSDFNVDQAGGANGLYFIKSGQGGLPGSISASQMILRATLESDGVTQRIVHPPIIRDVSLTAVCDYPSEDDVRNGVDFDSGNFTGNMTLPSENDVEDGVSYGTSGTEFTGNFEAPAQSDVLLAVQYGANGTEFTGTLKKYSVTTDSNDTLRQRIVDVLTTRLATITTGNGYKTDVGNSIHRWEGFGLSPDDQLPAIEYRDTTDDVDQIYVAKVIHTLNIDMRLISSRNTDATQAAAEQEMRKIIADLNQMIGTDQRWSELAEKTDLIDDEIEMEQLENSQWSATVSMQINYHTGRFNAYA